MKILLNDLNLSQNTVKKLPFGHRNPTSRFMDAGEMVAMMQVFVRPPSESCRIRVNLLSLKLNMGKRKVQ